MSFPHVSHRLSERKTKRNEYLKICELIDIPRHHSHYVYTDRQADKQAVKKLSNLSGRYIVHDLTPSSSRLESRPGQDGDRFEEETRLEACRLLIHKGVGIILDDWYWCDGEWRLAAREREGRILVEGGRRGARCWVG